MAEIVAGGIAKASPQIFLRQKRNFPGISKQQLSTKLSIL